MSNWELIDYNPHTGLKKYLGDNPDDPDGVLIRYEQDAKSIEAIIDRNKRMQNEATGPMGGMVHAASIPVGIMYEWKQKYNVDAWDPNQADRVKKLLNDPDYRYLKVRNIIL